MPQLASAGIVPLCKICTQPITRKIRKSRDSGRCCSRACGFELIRRERSAARSARLAKVAEIRRANRQRQCAECGAVFEAQASARFCSPQCWARSRAAKKVECSCRECGITFLPDYGDKRRVFCSETCSSRHLKRVSKGVERAQSYGVHAEPLNPIAVMERDGWTCHICGEEAPRELRGTMRWNAPELDHIIPLSVGGAHTYENVACAHRACNLDKGDALPPGSVNPERRWLHKGMGASHSLAPAGRTPRLAQTSRNRETRTGGQKAESRRIQSN